MRPADGGLSLFEELKFLDGLVAFAKVSAKDGVDEAGLRTEAEAFAKLDGFMDGGVIGNAVEPKDLVEAEAQENLNGEVLAASAGFAVDEPIEGALPADEAECEFVAEAAIRR